MCGLVRPLARRRSSPDTVSRPLTAHRGAAPNHGPAAGAESRSFGLPDRLRLANHDVPVGALDDCSQLDLLGRRNLELVAVRASPSLAGAPEVAAHSVTVELAIGAPPPWTTPFTLWAAIGAAAKSQPVNASAVIFQIARMKRSPNQGGREIGSLAHSNRAGLNFNARQSAAQHPKDSSRQKALHACG